MYRGISHGSLSVEAFGAVSESLCEQCLDSLVEHGEDSTLTYLLTADCATCVGITGQRNGDNGLGGGSTRFMEHARDIRGDARQKARHRAGECRSQKRVFGHTDDSQLTVLRLFRGPSASAAALERVLIRALRPTGNKAGTGSGGVPVVTGTLVRGRPRPWRRASGVLCGPDPVSCAVSRPPKILRREHLAAVRRLHSAELVAQVASGSEAPYRRKLDQFMLQGDIGPVPLSKELAVALMADTRGPPDAESLFRNERDVCAGVRLAKKIARPVIRARALRRFCGVLRTLYLPPHRRRVVKVTTEIPKQTMRKFRLHSLADLRCTRPSCCLGVGTDHLHLYTKRTFSSASCGAIAACKDSDALDILSSRLDDSSVAAGGALLPLVNAMCGSGRTDAIRSLNACKRMNKWEMRHLWHVHGGPPCGGSTCR